MKKGNQNFVALMLMTGVTVLSAFTLSGIQAKPLIQDKETTVVKTVEEHETFQANKPMAGIDVAISNYLDNQETKWDVDMGKHVDTPLDFQPSEELLQSDELPIEEVTEEETTEPAETIAVSETEGVVDKDGVFYEPEVEEPKGPNMVAYINPNDVTEITGADVDTLNILLKDTFLEGYGQLFYDLENEYGINALFSISNAITETGWDGDSYISRNRNNIYGLNNDTYYESKQDCIYYWYNLIKDKYVGQGRKSMVDIGTKYCPPNPNWHQTVLGVAKKLKSNAGITNE